MLCWPSSSSALEYAHRMLHAYSHMLYGHSKYSKSNISRNPLLLLTNSRRGGSYRLIPNLAHFLALLTSSRHAGLCAFRMYTELLNAHSKYGGICSIFHVGTSCNTIGLHNTKKSSSCHILNAHGAD